MKGYRECETCGKQIPIKHAVNHARTHHSFIDRLIEAVSDRTFGTIIFIAFAIISSKLLGFW